MPKVLVIGDDNRSFLGVIRSLGRAGWHVDIAPHTYNPVPLSSRHVQTVQSLPPVFLNPALWLRALEELDDTINYDLIIPCTDAALIPIMTLNHTLDMGRIAHPGRTAFDVFYDKAKTRKACEEVSVPIADAHSIDDILASETFTPFALKPKSSFDIKNLARKQAVKIIRKQDKAKPAIESLNDPSEYFCEDLFEGVGVGISVLADSGEVTQAFQHQRMAEGVSGGSSLRRAVPIHAGMFDVVKKLAAHTGLHGVAMFEFRYNHASDTFILIEVNARFWGSLPLAMYAGVDFPRLLVDQMCGSANPVFASYRLNVVGRALTPSFYYALGMLTGDGGLKGLLSLILNIPLSLSRTLFFKEKVDSFAYDDMLPFWHEIGDVRRIFTSSILRKSGLIRLQYLLERNKHQQILKSLAPNAKSILILCYGNICRSPFAGVHMSEKLEHNQITIKDMGFHPVGGRTSPTEAAKAAKEFDIDLTDHRSQTLSPADISSADIICVMDQKNMNQLLSLYPTAEEKTINLGRLTKEKTDIDDPYGKSNTVFTSTYNRLKEACVNVVSIIDEAQE